MARFKVGVQLHPQATTVDDLRAAWQAADALERRQHLGLGPLLPALRRSRRRALRGVHAARGDGRRDAARAASARSSPATRTATRTCSPTWRARSTTSATAASCSASARAGSSATTTSTATSSAPRPSRLRDLADALPIIMDRFEPPRRRRRAAALPILIGGSRREGHAAARRRARRRVEHVRAARRTSREKNRVLDEWCARLDRKPAPDRAHRRHPGDRDRRLAGLPRRRRRAPHRDDRPPVRPRPGRASPGRRPRLT